MRLKEDASAYASLNMSPSKVERIRGSMGERKQAWEARIAPDPASKVFDLDHKTMWARSETK